VFCKPGQVHDAKEQKQHGAGATILVYKAHCVAMNHLDQDIRLANQKAIEKLLSVRPQLICVGSAMSVLGLKNYTILHAGPPFKDIAKLPKTVESSIVLSALYEGWANNEQEVLKLLHQGLIELKPAQDYRCATPLAAMITPKTTLLCVNDINSDLPACYAPLSSGPGPDIRFGTNNLEVISSLALRDTLIFSALKAALNTPLDLFHFASIGLQGGDELHSSTAAATQALSLEIHDRLTQTQFAHDQIHIVQELIKSNPGFFLTPWMAACKLMLSSIEGIPYCSFITRIGGNGQCMGLSIAHDPTLWLTQTATPPIGTRFGHVHQTVEVEGVIGDSCVIDAMGFGGQLTSTSPQVLQILQEHLPKDYALRAAHIMSIDHDYFAFCMSRSTAEHEGRTTQKVRCGLDLLKITQGKCYPLVNIAMLARDGINGLLGRGLYELDPLLCDQAVNQLPTHSSN
jgi:hypothetical protein